MRPDQRKGRRERKRRAPGVTGESHPAGLKSMCPPGSLTGLINILLFHRLPQVGFSLPATKRTLTNPDFSDLSPQFPLPSFVSVSFCFCLPITDIRVSIFCLYWSFTVKEGPNSPSCLLTRGGGGFGVGNGISAGCLNLINTQKLSHLLAGLKPTL